MLEKLMQSIFHRVATLLSAKFTGRITFVVDVKDGRIMKAKYCPEEYLTIDP